MENYKLDGTGTGSMTHDGAGRVTTEFSRTYTYDDFHSLVRAGATSGSNAQGFQYDGVGRLIAVRRGTAGWPVEEEVAYDGTQMVAAWDGAQVGTWSATWGQGVDNLVSLKPAPGAGEVMAVKDGRGSVVGYYRGETPTQGLWVTADYTPEGRATQRDWVAGTSCTESGTTQCPRLGGLPFGFHGAYKSPAHGLLYFRNRWYSVEAGQWLTHDPLGEVDSVNLYAFNRFDSVNFIDPFGLAGSKTGAAPLAEAQCETNHTCPYSPGSRTPVRPVEQSVEPRSEPRPLENTSQAVAGISVGTGATAPKAGPPGPPEPPPSGEWGRFPKNQPKPPGGFNRGVQAAGETEKAVEQLARKAGPRLGVRTAARALGAVGVAIIIIDVAEVVGPPVLNAIEGQMTPEPAGTPGPQAASPEKPKPDHPASEPGVPEIQDQPALPEDYWKDRKAPNQIEQGVGSHQLGPVEA